MDKNIQSNLEEVLNITLSQEEAKVIKFRYGLCGNETHSYTEIAHNLNITPNMVRKIEYNALMKLRDLVDLIGNLVDLNINGPTRKLWNNWIEKLILNFCSFDCKIDIFS